MLDDLRAALHRLDRQPGNIATKLATRNSETRPSKTFSVKAFSSEAETGSRPEHASKQ